MNRTIPTLATIGIFTAASVALAASHAELPREIEARKGLMNVVALNFGVVGDMAKGKTDYEAQAAQAAADSLVGVSMIDQGILWPDATLGIEGSRALETIGTDRAGFLDVWQQFDTAAAELQTAAAEGPEALGAAVGKLGQACKACHDDYRTAR